MLPSMKSYSQVATAYQWGHGFGLNGCADGIGSDAMFNAPTDLALVKLEDKHVLYVADSRNNRVARVEVNMVLVDGTPTEEIPIVAIKDSSGSSVGEEQPHRERGAKYSVASEWSESSRDFCVCFANLAVSLYMHHCTLQPCSRLVSLLVQVSNSKLDT